jgi:hypothetical protein
MDTEEIQKCENTQKGTDAKEEAYIEACNIKNVWFRLPELITDPSSNQLSCSRFVFFWTGLISGFIALHETIYGRTANITTLLSTVIATTSGVYFASTVKDWRWKRFFRKEDE